MRGLLIMAAFLVAGPALAEPERRIPRGAEHPAVIESLFDSPFGEVQFTRLGLEKALGHSGFLRNSKGYLVGFSEVRGPAFCERWFLSDKSEPLPSGCEFVFHDENTGREIAVRSGEMTEASIFQTTKGKMRDLGRGLSAAGGTDVAL